jgi:DNA mismatch repair protein MutL
VLESDRGLVLLDQHAAHERVLYEQMLRRVQEGGTAPSQRLLLPETIELSPKDAAFLRENLGDPRPPRRRAQRIRRTHLPPRCPAALREGHRPAAFRPRTGGRTTGHRASVNSWRLGEAVVAKTVCRHSVKANDPLGPRELEALLENLRACDMPYTCPHGRPTLIEMNYRELRNVSAASPPDRDP